MGLTWPVLAGANVKMPRPCTGVLSSPTLSTIGVGKVVSCDKSDQTGLLSCYSKADWYLWSIECRKSFLWLRTTMLFPQTSQGIWYGLEMISQLNNANSAKSSFQLIVICNNMREASISVQCSPSSCLSKLVTDAQLIYCRTWHN